MKTIEFLVRITVEIEEKDLPDCPTEQLIVNIPLLNCDLFSSDNLNTKIPAEFIEFETMDANEI